MVKIGRDMDVGEVLGVLRRVGEEIRSIPGVERTEGLYTFPRRLMFLNYARCPSLYHGMYVLLRERKPNEAMILARPLFEESCHLRDLVEAGDQADAIILAWFEDSLRRRRSLIDNAVKSGFQNDPAPMLNHLGNQMAKVKQYKDQNGISASAKFNSYEARALADDRKNGLWAYEFSHQFVHGNEAQHGFMGQMNDDGVLEIKTVSEDVGWIASVGIFGADSMIWAYRAAAGIFGWPQPSVLDDLERDVQNLVASP